MAFLESNPQTESEIPISPDDGYPPAPWGKRLLAFIVDSLIAGLVMTLLAMAFLVVLFLLMSFQAPEFIQRMPEFVAYIWMAGMMVSFIWFCVYSLARDALPGGQSWGKRLFGLMVVNVETETPCSLIGSLIRNALGFVTVLTAIFIPYCGLLFLAVEPVAAFANPAGLRLGDRWSRTRVIEKSLFQEK